MRRLVRAILTFIVLCCAAGMAQAQMLETGIDRPGGDYSSTAGTPNPSQCQKLCQTDDTCRAWTWVKPGVQGSKSVCYLKKLVPPQEAGACCTSGVKLAGPIPPNAAPGTDRFGSDYASINLPAPKPAACADACAGDAACKAWTYVNPGIKGPKAVCFLKNTVPPETSDSCCVSGVKASLPPPAVLPPGAAAGKDRPGSDIAWTKLPNAKPQLCYDQCQANSDCKAWTYVRPGVQDAKAICYLKNAVPAAVNDSCCISGVKASAPPPALPPGAMAGKDRPGADFASVPLPAPDPKLCYDKCKANGACKAWTYVKPGVQGPKAICYLKKAVPGLVNDSCCVSGVMAAPPPGKIEKNTDRPGADYIEFPLGGQKTEALCMAACALQGNCKAWTFVKPGYQGPKARCWLKSKVPPAVADDCCTSGVK